MKKLLLTFSITLLSIVVFSQNVGIGTNSPDASAKLEVTSTNSGFLPPRLTISQRNAIQNPATGLVIFCTDCDELEVYNGTIWKSVNGVAGCVTPSLPNVTIGTQVWTTQNLDVAQYRNGDPIPQVTDPTEWANLTTGAWCWFNNDSATYAATYGRLYNWYAVNDSRGLSPNGWHIPSDGEWNKLIKSIDPSADTICQNCQQSVVAGGSMKETGTIHWTSTNTGATNRSGFAGLPGGYRNAVSTFYSVGFYGTWWSSTSNGSNGAWHRYITYNFADVLRYSFVKSGGFSVRLIRD